jgi:hypothetical protein
MSKGRKGRSPDQIRADRAEVARLYLAGHTQAEIGRQLSLSRQQIGYDLEAVRQDWLRSSLMDFNARKAEELAKIDHLEREYRDAWERSKTGQETTTTEQTTTPEGDRTKASIRKEEQHGDPRYLEGVRWCISKRCEILGLDAPKRVRVGGDSDAPPIRILDAMREDSNIRAAMEMIRDAVVAVGQRQGLRPAVPAANGDLPQLAPPNGDH